MGIYYLLAGQNSAQTFILILITGLYVFINPLFAQESLYDKVNQHEFITIADSLFVYRDDYQGAVQYYQMAIKNLNANEPDLLAYSYVKLSNAYTSDHQYENAKLSLEKAKKLLNKIADPNSLVQAEYDLYYGKYLLRHTEKHDSAEIYIDRSIDNKRKYHIQNVFSLAESLFFKAEYFTKLRMLSRAEETYREILAIYENNVKKDHILLGRLYSSMTVCLRDQFDFKNALDYAERAVQILRLDSMNNLNRLATATFFYANIYSRHDNYESSIPIYVDLLRLIQAHKELERFYYYVYSNLATSYTNTKQFDRAQFCLNEFYKTISNQGSIDPYNKAYYHLLYGEYYNRANRVNESIDHLLLADNIYEREVQLATNEHSLCNEWIGDNYYRLNLVDSALKYYQNALIIYLDNFEEENVLSNPASQDDPDKREIFDILYKKAKAWRKYYDLAGDPAYLKEALKIYNLIDKLNDQARDSKLKDASLLILSDYYHDGYEMAIDCTFELFQQTLDSTYLDNAFSLMEKSKSMLLFRSLVLAERDKSIDLPYFIKKHEDSLRMANVEYEQKIRQEKNSDHPDPQLIGQLEANKFQVIREMDKLKIKISSEYPAYYQIKYDSLTKDLDDFKNHCRNKNLLGIEYFWGDSAVYQLVTDGISACLIKIDPKKEFKSWVQKLLIQLSHGIDDSRPDADYRSYIVNAYKTYHVLLGGIMNKFDSFSKLLIIPDGILAQLPFEALITRPGDTTYLDYSSLPYLVKETAIVYAYSINLLLNSQIENKGPKKDLLAFSYSGLNTLADNIIRSGDVVELPHSAIELRAIKKVFPGKNRYFYNEDATEHQFKLMAPEYQILHLAVHGLADTREGDNSKLVFKQGKDTIDDGNLYMYELYGLDLSNTRLAVLSACETGIGQEFRGEGIFSMARGFTYAGCPAIIMSLWPVGDVNSATIMEDFYRFIKKGESASDAIRSSKLNFIKKQNEFVSHPAHWASFVYLGEEFNYQAGANLVLIFSIVITIVIIPFIYFKFFRPSS